MTPSTPLKKIENSVHGRLDDSGKDETTDTNLDVAEGSGVDLICGASGKPEPVIKWYAFDYETSNSIYLQSKFTKFSKIKSNRLFIYLM
jgi:hypothetical protein